MNPVCLWNKFRKLDEAMSKRMEPDTLWSAFSARKYLSASLIVTVLNKKEVPVFDGKETLLSHWFHSILQTSQNQTFTMVQAIKHNSICHTIFTVRKCSKALNNPFKWQILLFGKRKIFSVISWLCLRVSANCKMSNKWLCHQHQKCFYNSYKHGQLHISILKSGTTFTYFQFPVLEPFCKYYEHLFFDLQLLNRRLLSDDYAIRLLSIKSWLCNNDIYCKIRLTFFEMEITFNFYAHFSERPDASLVFILWQ